MGSGSRDYGAPCIEEFTQRRGTGYAQIKREVFGGEDQAGQEGRGGAYLREIGY